jgi:hypothetical protein|tara:strand:- start:764 stop:901 length:138 start_codon:yes stop_codon:yes gene_type:complete
MKFYCDCGNTRWSSDDTVLAICFPCQKEMKKEEVRKEDDRIWKFI